MADHSDLGELIDLARRTAMHAHAPYSGFHVGCVVEADNGALAFGANMENACYRLGTCAEIAALSAAMQTFGLARVRRVVVVGGRIDDEALGGGSPVSPCGGCRQAIQEARDLSGTEIEVVCCSGDGEMVERTTISALLPDAFGRAALKR